MVRIFFVLGGLLCLLGPYLIERGVVPKVWAGTDRPAAGPIYWFYCAALILGGLMLIYIGIFSM